MNQEVRRKVLSCFKQLHRARSVAFNGDEVALAAARTKINEEFVKNKNVSKSTVVEELVKYGQQVEEVLRKHVLKAVKVDNTTYRAEIHKDMSTIENANYREMPESMIGGPLRRKKKCGDQDPEGARKL